MKTKDDYFKNNFNQNNLNLRVIIWLIAKNSDFFYISFC